MHNIGSSGHVLHTGARGGEPDEGRVHTDRREDNNMKVAQEHSPYAMYFLKYVSLPPDALTKLSTASPAVMALNRKTVLESLLSPVT